MSNNPPVTMIVRHRVDAGKSEQFEQWRKGIRQVASQYAGFEGIETIRPVNESDEYACIIRFDSYANLEQWVDAPERQQWMEKTAQFSSQQPEVEHFHSLEFWFDNPEPKSPAAPPPKYKMALISFVVIWAQVTLLVPIIADWIGEPFMLITAVAVSTIVLLTTYLFMPLVTRLLHRWLFRSCRH